MDATAREDIARTMSLFLASEGDVVEIRALGCGQRGTDTWAGYFDDPAAAAREVVRLATTRPMPRGIYATANPVSRALLARAANRVRLAGRDLPLTSDGDILARRWLLLDFDPVRPSGVSASAAEHAAALSRAEACAQWLTARGWPEPVRGDSGNGAHLLYRVDLPNTAESTALVKRCLEALALRFDDESVRLDIAVYNPARIWKVYGTQARKGDNTQDRPHRVARILSTPDRLIHVPRECLESLAAEAPPPEPPASPRTAVGGHIDLARFLAEAAIPHDPPRPWNGGNLYRLRQCPFTQDHDDGAYSIEMPSGAVVVRCHHNRCRGLGWADLRRRYPAAARAAGASLATTAPRRRPAADADEDTGADEDDAESATEVLEPTPAFPTAALPGVFGEYVPVAAAGMGIPEDFVAGPLLAAAATALGGGVEVALSARHSESALVWIAVVGRPGAGKSPGFSAGMAPVYWQQELLDARFEQQKLEYKRALAAERRSAAKTHNSFPSRAPLPPDPPEHPHVFVADTTAEAMACIHKANPRGIVIAPDELGVFLQGLNAYRNGYGADRHSYEQSWSRQPLKIDRKTNDKDGFPLSITIQHPYICIAGGLQPDSLSLLTVTSRGQDAGNDGFLDRWLFCWPDDRPVIRPAPDVQAPPDDALSRAFGRLWAIPYRAEPLRVPLTPAARQVYEEGEDRFIAMANSPGYDWWTGPSAKLRTYRPRLALLLAGMRAACTADFDPSALVVDEADMLGADALIEYFTACGRKVWTFLQAGKKHRAMRSLWEWTVRRSGSMGFVTLRDIVRYGAGGCHTTAEARALIQALSDSGWGEVQERANPGARPTTVFIPRRPAPAVARPPIAPPAADPQPPAQPETPPPVAASAPGDSGGDSGGDSKLDSDAAESTYLTDEREALVEEDAPAPGLSDGAAAKDDGDEEVEYI